MRLTIGHVSHGWFSYQHGVGVGMGFVAAAEFVQLCAQQQRLEAEGDAMDTTDKTSSLHTPASAASSSASSSADSTPAVWVWCRNQNSLAYRAAQITLMKQ